MFAISLNPMKDYTDYSAEDFARDENFFKWIKYPQVNPALDRFWKNWLLDNPQKKEDIEEARQLVQAILEEKYIAAPEQQFRVWNAIQTSVQEYKEESKLVRLWSSVLTKAAVVLLVMGVGWTTWKFMPASQPIGQTSAVQQKLFEIQVNNGSVPKTITLPDGSSIVLQPHSKLEYDKSFSASTREVTLTGEAFFEVKKDASRPFLVHANEIVTRVIGTSFSVRNFANENIVVQVKTGKVSVFRQKEQQDENNEIIAVEGVVLTPNQQVEYERDKTKMTKSLVESPELLLPVAKLEFEFTDTPIIRVFDLIEEAYGVDIVYDKDAVVNCKLNASLSDVPLDDKIKLICKTINATHEMIDSQIVIYGKGCSSQ
jgi:transmembrane sensor